MNLPAAFRLMLVFCATAPFVAGQIHLHFGVDAGVPLTDTLQSTSNAYASSSSSSLDRYNSVTKRLLAGPVFRMDFGSGFGFEFDALYQRVDYDHAINSLQPAPASYSSQSFEQTSGNQWQFPVLIQYTRKLPRSKTALFLEGGPSFSHIGISKSTLSVLVNSNSTPSSSSTNLSAPTGTLAGVVAGAGIDIPFFHGHLRPELRYTHWFSQNAAPQATTVAVFSGVLTVNATQLFVAGPNGIPSFRVQPNEVSFLAGWTF